MGVESLAYAAWAMTAVAAAGSAASTYSANQQAQAQDRATRQAEENAKKQYEQSSQELRRQQQNQADLSGILAMNQQKTLSGGSTIRLSASPVASSDQGECNARREVFTRFGENLSRW